MGRFSQPRSSYCEENVWQVFPRHSIITNKQLLFSNAFISEMGRSIRGRQAPQIHCWVNALLRSTPTILLRRIILAVEGEGHAFSLKFWVVGFPADPIIEDATYFACFLVCWIPILFWLSSLPLFVLRLSWCPRRWPRAKSKILTSLILSFYARFWKSFMLSTGKW